MITVISPPAPVVTAAAAKTARIFAATDADEYANLLLAAAQGQIDGPDGWLGRSIGEQEIEYRFDRYNYCPQIAIELPLPIVNEIVSVKYVDEAGVEHTVDPGEYALDGGFLVPTSGTWGWNWDWRSGPFPGPRIRYKTGWKPEDVPPAIKHAIMLMAAELRTIAQPDGIVRREEVEGIGSKDFSVPDVVARQLVATAERLLAGYRVFRL